MDTAYCLRCDTFILDDSEAAYCSQDCYALDHPYAIGTIHPRPAVASSPPPRSSSPTPSSSSSGSSVPPQHRAIALSLPARIVTSRWMGKDRQGILNWAHGVGHDNDNSDISRPTPTTTCDEDDLLIEAPATVAAQSLHSRAPIFPLTAQILAAPTLSTLPSLLLDDSSASLVTPCTEDQSIVTPPDPFVYHPATPAIASPAPALGSTLRSALHWFTKTPSSTAAKRPVTPIIVEKSEPLLPSSDSDNLMPVGVDAYTFANEKERRKSRAAAIAAQPGACGTRAICIPPSLPSGRDWGGRWDDELLLEGLQIEDLPEQAVVDEDDEEENQSFMGRRQRRPIPTPSARKGHTETVQRGRTLSRHSRDRGHERLVYGVAVE